MARNPLRRIIEYRSLPAPAHGKDAQRCKFPVNARCIPAAGFQSLSFDPPRLMRLLIHHQLDTHRVAAQFAKLQKAVARDDFRSPNLKKLAPMPYWRFKLDQPNRLLVQFARHGNETVCLALEVIHNHAYEHSRFLRGASLRWDQLDLDDAAVPGAAELEAQAAALRYLHPERGEIHVLDKVLSFDDAQQAVYVTPAPLVLVGVGRLGQDGADA